MASPVQTITGIVQPSATFTRPSDTTQYAVGDLIANSVVGGSVTPLTWRMGTTTTDKQSFYVPGIRLKIDKASLTSAQFRVHLYKAAPTVAGTGDNGVFGTDVSGNANEIGTYDVTMVSLHADGVNGIAVPTEGVIEPQHVIGQAPGSYVVLYGLIEALATYTPASASIITAELIVEIS